MKRIAIIIGTRPNFMKAYPVYEALKNNFNIILIHTGQHFTPEMSKIFFTQLGFPKPYIQLNLKKKTKAGEFDRRLYINNNEYLKNKDSVINDLITTDSQKLGQIGEIRESLKIELIKLQPDLVMVFGDVTSTLASSLASKILDIKIAHVESGLRSGDLTMPEEVNRILTDYISDYYFVTEQSGIDHLKQEGITENVYLVGNTMIDTQKSFLPKAQETKYYESLDIQEKEYILVTLHRPSNVDNLVKLREIFNDLDILSKKEKIIYPIHPRTHNNLEKIAYLDKIEKNPNIILTKSLGYLEFTCLMTNCKYVITDSGGIQEETTALDIPCFTLRPNTERPSTFIENNGTNKLINNISEIELKKCKGSMALWDGNSSKRICNWLIENKIKTNLNITKKELNIYIEELKLKYDIPTKYVQDNNLLQKTKNKEIVINNKTFKIEFPNIWLLQESNNTQYQIHTLNQIIQSQISLFFYKEYDTKIIEYCIEIIVNWFKTNKKVSMSEWYKNLAADWQDMSSSYRLGNILLVYNLSKKFNISIDDELFSKEMKYHIEWIYIYLSTLENCISNHSLFLSRFLVLGCLECNIHNEYINFGINYFLKTIETNIDFTDYISKEHSTNYHILYYRQINKLLNILPKTNSNYNKLKNINDKMYNNLYYFINPNKHFVQIGDTDDKLSNYEFIELPELAILKSGGYCIYKNNNTHILLISNYHNKYHKHMDELSLTYYDECPILIEGGRYSYEDNKVLNNIRNDNEPWRTSYFLTQRSKNSIVIDNNYYSIWNMGHFLVNKTLEYGSGIIESKNDNGIITMHGENILLKLMQGIKHERKLIYESNKYLLIEDQLNPDDENTEIYIRGSLNNSLSNQYMFEKVPKSKNELLHFLIEQTKYCSRNAIMSIKKGDGCRSWRCSSALFYLKKKELYKRYINQIKNQNPNKDIIPFLSGDVPYNDTKILLSNMDTNVELLEMDSDGIPYNIDTSVQEYNNQALLKHNKYAHESLYYNDKSTCTQPIINQIKPKDKGTYTCTRHFHFHQDWELVEIKDNAVIFKHKILNKSIKFEDLSDGEIKYYYGQEEPFIQGFTSPSELYKIPIPTLEITNTFKGPIKLISKIIHIDPNKIEISDKVDNLDISTTTNFLDHDNEHILLSNGGHTIYESNNFGKSWKTYTLNIDKNYITHGKIINDKIFLAIEDNSHNSHVCICDENKNIINKNKIHYPWHGTWSIDYNDTVIMFGTYARCNENMYIYRSNNNGKSWDIVFSAKGHPNNPKEGDIRHFHTCTYDKFTNKWYISSGDRREQNKMWESRDNGITWQQITFNLIKDNDDIKFGLTSNYAKQLVRHTAEININSDIMIWCTDDKIDGNARVCIFNKKTYDLIIGDKLGNNPIRSFTKINNEYGLAISESKFKDNNDKLYVDFYLIHLNTYKAELVKTIENIETKISGFNYSIASKKSYNNVMFCFSDFNNGYVKIKVSDSNLKDITIKDKKYIQSKIEDYSNLNSVEFKYTNLRNKDDIKILKKKIKLNNAIIAKEVYYENDHKRAILELTNKSNKNEKIILINNNNDAGNVDNIKLIQNKSTIDEEEFMCNICNENIYEKYTNNLKINHIYLKENEIGTPVSCYKCSYCNSRLRIRTLKKILGKTIIKKESCIINSSPLQERELVSNYLNIEKHIDYHIQRGDLTCEVGVDISKPINTNKKYKYFIATCVFDSADQGPILCGFFFA